MVQTTLPLLLCKSGRKEKKNMKFPFLSNTEEERNSLPERLSQIHTDGHRSKFQAPGRRGKEKFLFRIGFITPAGSRSPEYALGERRWVAGEIRPPVKCTGAT